MEYILKCCGGVSGKSRSEERRVGKECRSLCDWSSDVCSSDLLFFFVSSVSWMPRNWNPLGNYWKKLLAIKWLRSISRDARDAASQRHEGWHRMQDGIYIEVLRRCER